MGPINAKNLGRVLFWCKFSVLSVFRGKNPHNETLYNLTLKEPAKNGIAARSFKASHLRRTRCREGTIKTKGTFSCTFSPFPLILFQITSSREFLAVSWQALTESPHSVLQLAVDGGAQPAFCADPLWWWRGLRGVRGPRPGDEMTVSVCVWGCLVFTWPPKEKKDGKCMTAACSGGGGGTYPRPVTRWCYWA